MGTPGRPAGSAGSSSALRRRFNLTRAIHFIYRMRPASPDALIQPIPGCQ